MPADAKFPQVYLARHGETEWSLSGQHTGTTDLPLLAHGETQARQLGERLAGIEFDRVWSSPRIRATRTAELAGFVGRVEVVPDLAEWHYGDYEGLLTDEIHARHPGWLIYRDGCPNGESPEEVSARADRVVARLRKLEGTTIIFCHGHFTRIVAIRWLGLPILDGRFFKLGTASLSRVSCGHDREDPVIDLWNDRSHVG